MSFGLRLRQLRKDKNLTLRELENEIGISFSALGKYERDEREPDFDTLEKIASYFGVMIDWLIGRTNIKTFDEYVFMNDVRHLEEKLKETDPKKRKLVVTIVDQVYLLINRHLNDPDNEALELIAKVINNLFWFDGGIKPFDYHKSLNTDNPEDILDYLSSHKSYFNSLFDELFKIQLKEKNRG